MQKAVKKLQNILELESESYQDRAVYGGLAQYAKTWTKEAHAAFGPQLNEWIDDVAERLRVYSDLADLPARQRAVATLQDLVDEPPTPEKAPPPEPEPTPEQRRPSAPEPSSSLAHTGLDSPIMALRGVGDRQSERLERLGVHTIRDLIYLLPRRHDDYSQLKPINRLAYGEEVTIIAKVKSARGRRTRSGRHLFKVTLTDGTGYVDVTWFNQPYLANQIKPGRQIVISGDVDEYMGRLCFTAPEWELLEDQLLHTGRLVPVYPLTKGLGAKWLRRLVKRTVDYWSRRMPDHLPASIMRKHDLMPLEEAIVQVHFPDTKANLEQARHRLAFDELFLLQIGLLRHRREWRSEPGKPLPADAEVLKAFVETLPYELTNAQKRALEEIVGDVTTPKPMNRLLHGDVGSGKTVVATAAMVLTVAAGAQAALMAPTEILTEQHYQTVSDLLAQMEGEPPTVRLLTGSVTGQEREAIYEALASGEVDIVIGTHALIQEAVTFDELALAVIDEQHRFGVEQRAALRQKGYNPHLLVMTATPIPRSLELTMWGHLDVSAIDEMPPGRQPVLTRWLKPTERERAYSFVRSQVEDGFQAFIICPLVEESEKIEAKAAVEEYERLQETIFPKLKLGLLHGRMSGDEKDAVMTAFADGELDILVATSVVEVGIDVPNATVMLVEGAERFGLAQLHQFRGRVGRSEHESYCLLIAGSTTDVARERLEALEATNDGFVLAEKDLEMRGPGEFLGARQSGFPDLKMASVTDLELVKAARRSAREFFQEDPELSSPDHRLLARKVERFWKGIGEIS